MPKAEALDEKKMAQGNHKGLPLRINIFVTRHKNLVVGAILYGCPESLQKMLINSQMLFKPCNEFTR